MSNEVFISYSRKDYGMVRSIKQEIDREVGINCWMDLDGIESGDLFKKVIISAINSHNTVLFMQSYNSMRSEFAMKELNFANSKHKRIILVDIDHFPMTDDFSFDFGDKDNINWSDKLQRTKLINNLKKWFKKDTAESVSNMTKKEPKTNDSQLYVLVLETAGASKLQVVKATYELFGLGLKEAKDYVDGAPSILPGTYTLDDANSKSRVLEEAGARISVLTEQYGSGRLQRCKIQLNKVGASKLQVVKAVHELFGLGLKEAKDYVDGAPSILPGTYTLDDANSKSRVLEEAGARISVLTKQYGRGRLQRCKIQLNKVGASKLQVVKAVYEIFGVGLKEAKDYVDAAPVILIGDYSIQFAQKAQREIERAGGSITILKQNQENKNETGTDVKPRPRTPINKDKLPGRNDPCPCGSGKKFKNCHGKGIV